MASESRQRQLMKTQLEDIDIEAESVPFSFNTKKGYPELRPAPIAYAKDLKSIVYHLLNEKER